MSANRKYYEGLPEVREQCMARCDGHFGPDRAACREVNRDALRERMRREAAAYGVKSADDPRQA